MVLYYLVFVVVTCGVWDRAKEYLSLSSMDVVTAVTPEMGGDRLTCVTSAAFLKAKLFW
jgi:hypothetical protein